MESNASVADQIMEEANFDFIDSDDEGPLNSLDLTIYGMCDEVIISDEEYDIDNVSNNDSSQKSDESPYLVNINDKNISLQNNEDSYLVDINDKNISLQNNEDSYLVDIENKLQNIDESPYLVEIKTKETQSQNVDGSKSQIYIDQPECSNKIQKIISDFTSNIQL